MTGIKENWQTVYRHISDAAQRSGRKAEDITLVAVTKTIDIVRIQELLPLGARVLGENKVQELLAKYGHFEPEPEWHMIGHLQTNKVKYIIDKVAMIQSVDSLRLAEEIDKRAGAINKRMNVLVEVNIGGEDTKYGLPPNQIECFVEQLCYFPNICVSGLMCVAPFVKNAAENRTTYKKMFKLFVDIKMKFAHNTDMQYLSMGMTNDYETAIEEGANMVRIGTALFGARIL